MPMTTTNNGERLDAEQIDEKRKVWKGQLDDNLQLVGYDGTQHALTIHNPNTGGLALLVNKSDGITPIMDLRDDSATFTGDVTVSGDFLNAGPPIFNVVAFGADPTGAVAADAVVASAIAAMPSGGGTLYFPAGDYKFTAPIVIPKPMTVAGDGMFVSVVRSSSTTSDVFTITTPLSVHMHDFSIATASTPRTAGAGIRMSMSGTSNKHSRFERIHLQAMHRAFDMQDAAYWVIFGCLIEGVTQLGVYVANTTVDEGDSKIIGNVFSSTAVTGTAGVYHVSSGGLIIADNKFLGFGRSYQMELASGAVTGALIIANNSMELAADGAISFTSGGGGAGFASVQITANSIRETPVGVGVFTAGVWLAGIVVSANHFSSGVSEAIHKAGGNAWVVTANQHLASGAGQYLLANVDNTGSIYLGPNLAYGSNYRTGFTPTTVDPNIQTGADTATTNTAFFGGFRVPTITVTFAPAYNAVPKITVTPIGATAVAAQILTSSATGFTYTILGTTNATSLSANWSAFGEING